MTTPLLGLILPKDRTREQNDAHYAAIKSFARFGIAGGQHFAPPKGTKIILTSFFDAPEVMTDIGAKFNGFRQLTGSCVGVSTGDAIATLSAVQRVIGNSPTKAFIPWWGFVYGRCRYNEGDRGQGEGAVDSVMGQTIRDEGCFSVAEAQGLPQFSTSDGYAISSREELTYSDGAYSGNTQYLGLAKQHPVGGIGICNSTQDIIDGIVNGYPNLNGCDNYVGGGSLQSGVCIGAYDGRGGHSTCYIGYWNHENLGELLLYWNQWDGSTYPEDGSGKPRCSTWVKRATVDRLFQTGGSGGETMALSHLSYFPAQPKVLDWTP